MYVVPSHFAFSVSHYFFQFLRSCAHSLSAFLPKLVINGSHSHFLHYSTSFSFRLTSFSHYFRLLRSCALSFSFSIHFLPKLIFIVSHNYLPNRSHGVEKKYIVSWTKRLSTYAGHIAIVVVRRFSSSSDFLFVDSEFLLAIGMGRNFAFRVVRN